MNTEPAIARIRQILTVTAQREKDTSGLCAIAASTLTPMKRRLWTCALALLAMGAAATQSDWRSHAVQQRFQNSAPRSDYSHMRLDQAAFGRPELGGVLP